MADHLSLRTVLALGALALPAAAGAQALSDPMRPPAEFVSVAAKGGAATLPRAQVVILGQGRRQVTLNGQTRREGERLGDADVESFTDSEVVLRTDSKARERIPLYPGITKTPSVANVKPVQGPGAGRTEGKK